MGTGFLMGIDIFHGYGFGTAKPSGFVPVAISIITCMQINTAVQITSFSEQEVGSDMPHACAGTGLEKSLERT